MVGHIADHRRPAAAELISQQAECELHAALEQVRGLQKKLEAENVYLQNMESSPGWAA